MPCSRSRSGPSARRPHRVGELALRALRALDELPPRLAERERVELRPLRRLGHRQRAPRRRRRPAPIATAPSQGTPRRPATTPAAAPATIRHERMALAVVAVKNRSRTPIVVEANSGAWPTSGGTTSAAVRVVRSASVGAATVASRSAWWATAASNTLRTNRALPKPRVRGSASMTSASSGSALIVEVVLLVLAHQLEDRDELLGRVVGEVDGAHEAALQAGVGVDQLGHLVRVAGGDDRQVVAVVLHELDDRVDRLPPEVLLAAPGERIGLVDEQRPAERGLHRLPRPHGRLADVAGDEVGAVGLHEVALGHDAEGPQDLAQQTSDGRLAGARIAGEHEVVTGLEGRQPPLLAELLDPQQARQAPDVGLHLVQPDERVQLGEQRLDRPFRRQRRLGLGAAWPPPAWLPAPVGAATCRSRRVRDGRLRRRRRRRAAPRGSGRWRRPRPATGRGRPTPRRGRAEWRGRSTGPPCARRRERRRAAAGRQGCSDRRATVASLRASPTRAGGRTRRSPAVRAGGRCRRATPRARRPSGGCRCR